MLHHHLTLSLSNALLAMSIKRDSSYLWIFKFSITVTLLWNRKNWLFFTLYIYCIIQKVTLHVLKFIYSFIVLLKLKLKKNSVSQLTLQLPWKCMEIFKTAISTLTALMISLLGYIFLKLNLANNTNKESKRSNFIHSLSKLI